MAHVSGLCWNWQHQQGLVQSRFYDRGASDFAVGNSAVGAPGQQNDKGAWLWNFILQNGADAQANQTARQNAYNNTTSGGSTPGGRIQSSQPQISYPQSFGSLGGSGRDASAAIAGLGRSIPDAESWSPAVANGADRLSSSPAL